MRAPLLRLLLLLCLTVASFGAVVNTTLDLRSGGTPPFNVVNQATINGTENTVTVQITAGSPRVLQMSSTTAWYYRSSSGGNVIPVAAGQSLTLIYQQNTVFYFVQQSAGGNLTLVCLR